MLDTTSREVVNRSMMHEGTKCASFTLSFRARCWRAWGRLVPSTQQLSLNFDFVFVFGVRFDKPLSTSHHGFHFSTDRTQFQPYMEVRQVSDQNSLAISPYQAYACWHIT